VAAAKKAAARMGQGRMTAQARIEDNQEY